jgi:hypothetical protein
MVAAVIAIGPDELPRVVDARDSVVNPTCEVFSMVV